MLVVPESKSSLDKILLAYDGNDLAQETLYTTAYLASRWNIELTVLTVHNKAKEATRIQHSARKYLESKSIQAKYVINSTKGIVEAILSAASEHGSNLIVMGPHGQNAPWYVNVGSAVTPVLQKSNLPVLICG
jgi:nucleotide-binding universal stress UspA family protein